ncbi:hypothetical protein ZEAMMB73_Zm00001d039255 [Zea mays]|uniref:Uncharacterized protein n=1 Tax=Zea mays TaxID=4577 RepID=A0A1D6MER5_MAIZE|nr:hypothetical protein ZEAMMB73_Zm00001d039255 [Zea mays]
MLETMYPHGVNNFLDARSTLTLSSVYHFQSTRCFPFLDHQPLSYSSLQNPPSNLSNGGVENCHLLQSFSAIEDIGFDLEMHQGEGFLEGMLLDGWLLNLVRICGFVEDSVASWTLTNLLHSPNEKLQVSAADFWDGILSLDEAGEPLVNLGYFPSYSVLKRAMLSYGYLFDTSGTKASISGSTAAGGPDDSLPHNIIAWLRVVSACCKISSQEEQKDILKQTRNKSLQHTT